MVRPGAGGVDGMVFLGRRKSESLQIQPLALRTDVRAQ